MRHGIDLKTHSQYQMRRSDDRLLASLEEIQNARSAYFSSWRISLRAHVTYGAGARAFIAACHLPPATCARMRIGNFDAKSARQRDGVQCIKTGGAYRDRTDDPLLAKQVLSQLS